MSVGERLDHVISLKYKTLTDFSRQTKIPYTTLQNYLYGKREPGADSLIKIKTHLGVSIDWLLMGEGEIYNKPVADIPQDIKEMVGVFERLSLEQRRVILEKAMEMVRVNELESKVQELERRDAKRVGKRGREGKSQSGIISSGKETGGGGGE